MVDNKCDDCWEKLLWGHWHTKLGFNVYECKKCEKYFMSELWKGYKIFYGILITIVLYSWIVSVIEWDIPVFGIVLLCIIGSIFSKDYNIKQTGIQNIKKPGKKLIIILGLLLIWLIFAILMQKDPIIFTEEQKIYIWNWQWEGVSVLIDENAYIQYQIDKNGVYKSLSWPISYLDSNHFKVSIGFITSDFKINQGPYKKENLWKMELDWNKLSKIQSISDLKVPELEELNKLTDNFFISLKKWAQEWTYKVLYENISKLWQSQIDANFFEEMFSNSNIKNIDFDAMIASELIYLQPPFINEQNLMILEGRYLWEWIWKFKLTFIYEYPNWKIGGFRFY